MKKLVYISIICTAVLLLGMGPSAKVATAQDGTVMWINHLDFLPGDPSIIMTSFNAVDSGVGDGLSGLIIESSTLGEEAGKVVEKGLIVPPGYLVSGVRICYEASAVGSYISLIQLSQVENPPEDVTILLYDDTNLVDPGPVCVDSAVPSALIDPAAGGLRLSLGLNFGNTADRIVLRSVGLNLELDPDSLILQAVEAMVGELGKELAAALMKAVENHSHLYLTGKAVGHNKKLLDSGPGEISDDPVPVPEPWKRNKKKKK